MRNVPVRKSVEFCLTAFGKNTQHVQHFVNLLSTRFYSTHINITLHRAVLAWVTDQLVITKACLCPSKYYGTIKSLEAMQ